MLNLRTGRTQVLESELGQSLHLSEARQVLLLLTEATTSEQPQKPYNQASKFHHLPKSQASQSPYWLACR